jgi:hypothetical protein
MMLCIATGGQVKAMAFAAFVLSWTHSVEKTEWRENWQVTDTGLKIAEARVKGSGAGMDPGEGARRIGNWWVWHPDLPTQREIVLSNSGSTVSGWNICGSGQCTAIPREFTGTVRLYPCEAGSG